MVLVALPEALQNENKCLVSGLPGVTAPGLAHRPLPLIFWVNVAALPLVQVRGRVQRELHGPWRRLWQQRAHPSALRARSSRATWLARVARWLAAWLAARLAAWLAAPLERARQRFSTQLLRRGDPLLGQLLLLRGGVLREARGLATLGLGGAGASCSAVAAQEAGVLSRELLQLFRRQLLHAHSRQLLEDVFVVLGL